MKVLIFAVFFALCFMAYAEEEKKDETKATEMSDPQPRHPYYSTRCKFNIYQGRLNVNEWISFFVMEAKRIPYC